MSRPVDSSIRSRHTGHVGSSTRAGVGGAIGFVLNELDGMVDGWLFVLVAPGISVLDADGVKGSLVISGKDGSWPAVSRARNSIDLTKTT